MVVWKAWICSPAVQVKVLAPATSGVSDLERVVLLWGIHEGSMRI